MMPDELQQQYHQLIQELIALKEFRRGSVTTGFPKCGKKNCICKQQGEVGHETTILTRKVNGKTKTRSIPSSAAVDVVTHQIARHKQFEDWSRRWKELNEQLADIELDEVLTRERTSGEVMKKKRRRKSSRK